MDWIEVPININSTEWRLTSRKVWMNTDAHKKALGVNSELKFQSCNMEVNQAFTFQGDGMHNSGLLLPELVNEGVRLLVYAGNADAMCNFIGNERWVNDLETKFKTEFQASSPLPWVTAKGGKVAGVVRSAGGGGETAGNVTFVTVYEAGHMVPFDQPEAALVRSTSLHSSFSSSSSCLGHDYPMDHELPAYALSVLTYYVVPYVCVLDITLEYMCISIVLVGCNYT
jgi:carboxypeptidase C (cathepsin A)